MTLRFNTPEEERRLRRKLKIDRYYYGFGMGLLGWGVWVSLDGELVFGTFILFNSYLSFKIIEWNWD